MNILILSPLFPPDIGDPAPYVKNLSKRLSENHTVSILLYGYLPEGVPAKVHCVDKRKPQVLRLFSYTKKLFALAKRTDLIIINNGPSTELPVFLFSLLYSKPLIYCESDHLASKNSASLKKLLSNQIKKRSKKHIILPETGEYITPEILPFTEKSQTSEYKTWWAKHCLEITTI